MLAYCIFIKYFLKSCIFNYAFGNNKKFQSHAEVIHIFSNWTIININMSQRLLILSTACALFYICITFHLNTQAKSLADLFHSLLRDSFIQAISLSCILLLSIRYIWSVSIYFWSNNKFYAHRISIEEYEKQKQTYKK